MEIKVLNSLFNKLQLIVDESVFLFKGNSKKLLYVISKETLNKLDIINPDAIYIFNKQPYILFFDLTSKENQDRIEEIHKQVWSLDQAPLVIFVKENSEEYYNAFDFDKRTGKLSEILDKDVQIKCNFWNLQSGETLDWFNTKYRNSIRQKRVNQQLFENIKQTILLLKNKFNLEEGSAKILILRLIFIRYLIDRKIKIDNSYILGDENDVIARRKSLSELISDPNKLVSFFDYLNSRFNGVLFKKSNFELTIQQCNLLSRLFSPDGVSEEEIISLFSGFDFQYEIFDFGIIPVELISGIYETLLDEDTKNATSAVYTPPFLVDYILTETVDKYFEENKLTSHCKIFDPAMGSGIFLVQGLRRMIERELEINPMADNLTFGNNIRDIAERNLFGIDINQEAIDVACFSIYVALLDYQEPGDIDIYHFPNLRDNNFFKVHFFDLEKESLLDRIKGKKLDFILGNPPWKNNSSPEHLNWLKSTKFNNIVSDKQIAQSYLIRVKDFANENTNVALIVTSKVFYNNKALNFKKYFLENNSISQLFDLSAVRDIVFQNAKNPGAIVFFKIALKQKEKNSKSLVRHISLKRNKFFNKFSKNLVIEKNDQKIIKQIHFLENEWMFKISLYGNSLDYVFLKRFVGEDLKDFLDREKIKYGKGIELGNPKKPFPFLENLSLIKKENYTNYYINNSNLIKLGKNDIFVKAGRDLCLFDENKIILGKRTIKETFLKFAFSSRDSTFTENFYGITFKDDFLLKLVFSLLNSNFFLYYQYLTTANWGVYNPEINLNEYLSFPFVTPSKAQLKKLVSLVDDLLEPYNNHYKIYPEVVFQGSPNEKVLKEINSIIEEIYMIKDYEKDLMDYVLNISRYQFQESKQKLVSDFGSGIRNELKVLNDYVKIYIKEFEKIYDESFFQVEIYKLNHFIAMNFIVHDDKPKETEQILFVDEVNSEKKLFEKLSTLSFSQIVNNTNNDLNLFIQKDIKGFEENSFYIIKPKEYKCWHKAMAWYDVAEFKEAIQKAELERIHLRNE